MTSLDFNAENQDLINSNGFQNNDLISSQEFLFFSEKSKFLWKELMKINTNYIEKSKDMSLIEPYVNNILYSRLFPNNIDLLSNEYIVQLVTLLQLTGQYLVYTQKNLENENEELKQRLSEIQYNSKDSERNEKIINDLRKQNQEKDFIIKTYQDMIKGGYGMSEGIDNKNLIEKDNTNLRSKKDGTNDKNNYFYCKICSGKKFYSQKFLDEHMRRRHYYEWELSKNNEEIYQNKKEEKTNKYNFDEKLKAMREDFEKLLNLTSDNNEFNHLNKRLDIIQNQIIEQNTNPKFFNNYIPNGICRNCQQKLNQNIPQNYNSKKNKNSNYQAEQEQVNEIINSVLSYKQDLDKQMNEFKNLNKKNKFSNEEKSSHININKIIKNPTYEEVNVNYKNVYGNKMIEEDPNKIYRKSLTESTKKESMSNNQNNAKKKISPKKVGFQIGKEEENILNQNSVKKSGGNNENNKNMNNKIENVEQNIIKNSINLNISNKIDNPGEENENIINEGKDLNIVNDNDKERGDPGIYKKSINTNSPKFSVNDMNKNESRILFGINPNSDLDSFYIKFMERDNKYKGEVEDYKIIKLPQNYRVNNDEIEEKVDEKIGDKNNISFSKIDNLIYNYEQKLNSNRDDNKYEKNLFKALDLEDIFNNYKEYKSRNSKKQNSQNNQNSGPMSSIKNSNYIMSGSNSGNKNSSKNNNMNNNSIHININNNNEDTTNRNYIMDSTLNLIGKNMELPQSHQNITQNIILGHDIKNSVM